MDERAPEPLLRVDGLTQSFRLRSGGRQTERFTAVDAVSLVVARGERVGIVGESGSGKSTLSRAIVGLRRPDHGSVVFDGTDVYSLSRRELVQLRCRLQLVLQDPSASLDPRMSVRDLVREGLEVHRRAAGADAAVAQVLDQVGIPASLHERKPHALSGGQRQRVALARSIVLGPDLVVLDEPVSALDVSVQGQILNLLLDLQDAHGLAYVFVVHDLAVARWFCHRVLVMRQGRIVEEASSEQLFTQPRHPYTKELLAAAPGTL